MRLAQGAIGASQERVDRLRTKPAEPYTFTILLALATVGIPALTEATVATTRLVGGTGAGGQHTYLRKA
jgi:hypothetical protein